MSTRMTQNFDHLNVWTCRILGSYCPQPLQMVPISKGWLWKPLQIQVFWEGLAVLASPLRPLVQQANLSCLADAESVNADAGAGLDFQIICGSVGLLL